MGPVVVEVAERNIGTLTDGGVNRRAAFRVEVCCPVEVRFDGGRTLATVTEDISMTGTRIRTPEALRKGTRATLRVEHGDDVAEVVTQVMHSQGDTFGAHAGMHFVVIDALTRGRLTRFIANEDRRRLPSVRVMYDTTCSVAGESDAIGGSTQECTPGFVRLLLRRAIEPASSVRCTITTTEHRFRLDGRITSSRRAGDLWSTGVQLSHDDAVLADTWTGFLSHLRATRH